jgi:hypothetical protein
MHSWGFALREGVFAETKEGKAFLRPLGKQLVANALHWDSTKSTQSSAWQ